MNATRVRCYAGACYPERPVTFEWEDAWLEVAEVLWQTRTAEGLVFNVLTVDRLRYRLEWSAANDTWKVTELLIAPPKQERPTG